jgi:hypothetical protein
LVVVIFIGADDAETQPPEFVTVYVYVPAARPDTVKLNPDQSVVTFPGVLVIVQAPSGNPSNTTLPVAVLHSEGVIVPTVGAAGIPACESIITLADGADAHPAWVTVNVYVPPVRLVMVVVVPDPENDPPDQVIVHAPEEGRPLSPTLPKVLHVGWVTVPIVGALGLVPAFICTLPEAGDVHPDALVTVYV